MNAFANLLHPKTLKNLHFQPSDASQRIAQLCFIAFVNLFVCHVHSAISKQLRNNKKGFFYSFLILQVFYATCVHFLPANHQQK
jgi:uncharacterized membrane protein YwaF